MLELLKLLENYSEAFKSLASIATLVTAIFAYIKYKKEKNKEFYLKRISGVYAPLYSYIVKQEAAREIFANFNETFEKKYTRELNPLFELENNNEVFFKPEEFLVLAKNVDKSLMSPKLISLIGALESIYYFLDNDNKETEKYLILKRREVERKIVDEVISEYMKCIKRVDADSKNEIINLEEYKIDEL